MIPRDDKKPESARVAVIGRIPPVADLPDADSAIFLDGDPTNLDDDNLRDFNFYCEAYRYQDYLDDFIARDRLLMAYKDLQRELVEAKEVIAQQAIWVARIQRSFSDACPRQRPSGEQKTLDLF